MSTGANVTSAAGTTAIVPTVIKHRSAATELSRAFTLDEEPVRQRETKSSGGAGLGDQLISDTEKQYFTNLFPTAADAIRSYSPYQKNGMKRSASIGTLVDVKG